MSEQKPESTTSSFFGGQHTSPGVKPSRQSIFGDGEILNDTYEVKYLLGRGGMGEVYEAQDKRLNRKVAIKAAAPDVLGASRYLQREGQALAAVHHPGLVAIHAHGTHRSIDYLVLERIYGAALDMNILERKASERQYSIPEVLAILTALSEALAAVHRAGVTHRDVTPGNIMMAPGNRVVLMDFGIVLPEIEVEDSRREGALGTPHYVAPEVIRNHVEPGAGHLVDMYSLGIIAFQLLTMTLPFEGATIGDLMHQHLYAPIPDLAPLRPGVPPALAALVRDLLAKEPRDRPQTMESVLWQLRTINARAELAPAKPPPLARGRFSILMVVGEDVRGPLRESVRRAVASADVRTVNTADQAIKAVEKATPHLIVLDLALDGSSGTELYMMLCGLRVPDRCQMVLIGDEGRTTDGEFLRQLGAPDVMQRGPDLGRKVGSVVRKMASGR